MQEGLAFFRDSNEGLRLQMVELDHKLHQKEEALHEERVRLIEAKYQHRIEMDSLKTAHTAEHSKLVQAAATEKSVLEEEKEKLIEAFKKRDKDVSRLSERVSGLEKDVRTLTTGKASAAAPEEAKTNLEQELGAVKRLLPSTDEKKAWDAKASTTSVEAATSQLAVLQEASKLHAKTIASVEEALSGKASLRDLAKKEDKARVAEILVAACKRSQDFKVDLDSATESVSRFQRGLAIKADAADVSSLKDKVESAVQKSEIKDLVSKTDIVNLVDNSKLTLLETTLEAEIAAKADKLLTEDNGLRAVTEIGQEQRASSAAMIRPLQKSLSRVQQQITDLKISVSTKDTKTGLTLAHGRTGRRLSLCAERLMH